MLLLGLKGTPFLYAGEELGLEDAVIPRARVVDPGGRDGCRGPVPWDASPKHGWTGADPWLPWPPDPQTRNAAILAEDPHSILQLYRRLLTARRGSAALQGGSFEWLPSPDGVLAWTRTAGDDVRAVVVNFTGDPAEAPLDGDWVVEVATDIDTEGRSYTGELGPDVAAFLRLTS